MSSTIVASPFFGPEEEATSESIQLDIAVEEADWLGFFDVMEIWRSRSTVSGPYEELTAEAWKTARLPKTGGDPPAAPVTGPQANLVGETFLFEVNQQNNIIEIVLTGTDPLTYAEMATQITSGGNSEVRSYVDEFGKLVVETLRVGTGAMLREAGGTAAAAVGLPTLDPSNLVFGKDARAQLYQGLTSYTFTDQHGSSNYFYKVRFRNSHTGALSDFSQPMMPSVTSLGIDQDQISVGSLELVYPDGRPIMNAEVRVFAKFKGEIVGGKVLGGGVQVKRTDESGRVEFNLIKGQEFSVAIIGTSITRDIVVPTDVSTFNLLGAGVAKLDDLFRVRVPDYVYAERRTL